MQRTKSNGYYIGVFVLFFFGVSFLLGIIQYVFDFRVSGMSAAIPMLSAMMAGTSFLKHENRMLRRGERSQLTNLSFLVTVLINVFVIWLAYATGALAELMPGDKVDFNKVKGLIIGVTILVVILIYIGIRLGYGSLLKGQARAKNIDPEILD